MTDILNIEYESIFDNHIVKIETHTYNSIVNTTFEYNDEIRINSKIYTSYRMKVFYTSREN